MHYTTRSKKNNKNNNASMRKLILLTTLITITMTVNSQKVLVAYFSATGTTKAVAEKVAKASNGALFEITPKEAYSSADLDWTDKTSRSSVEMKDKSSRPAIKTRVGNIATYDVVYIGYPIWWYVAPTIINTFIESHDLGGKTIIPFATSGGSPIEPTVDALRKQYPNLNIRDGKLLNRPSDATIKDWIR